jgi:hypothetical protein
MFIFCCVLFFFKKIYNISNFVKNSYTQWPSRISQGTGQFVFENDKEGVLFTGGFFLFVRAAVRLSGFLFLPLNYRFGF